MDRGAARLQVVGERSGSSVRPALGQRIRRHWVGAPLLLLAAMLTLPASAEAPGPLPVSKTSATHLRAWRLTGEPWAETLPTQQAAYRQPSGSSVPSTEPVKPATAGDELPFRGINDQIFYSP